MNCLLVAATAFEIAPFLAYYRDIPAERDMTHHVDVLVTGIGLTATAYSLTRQLALSRPDIVVQAGIAGCFDKELLPGSTVIVKRDMLADQGVTENGTFKTIFDMGLAPAGRYPFRNGWLVNNNPVLKKIKLPKVNGVSVNEITTSRSKTMLYRDGFGAVVESMEGAAFHYVCAMEKLPYIQLRGISNYVGERDRARWKMKESIAGLNNELLKLLDTI